jgi:TPR repeat protein
VLPGGPPAAVDGLQERDYDQAVMRYMMLAEMGYEVAQHNAAYLLDAGEGFPDVCFFLCFSCSMWG